MDFKTKWIEKIEGDREYYETPPDHFGNWDRNSKPEWMSERCFTNGLSVLYSSGGQRAVVMFLQAAIDVVDRAFEEDKFHLEMATIGLPLNIGEALRVRAYARALMGNGLDADALILASKYYVEWCSDWTGADWDSQAQSDYLVGVRMSLIAGDLGEGHELLKSKRSFKWHAEEHALLKAIASEAEQGVPIENDDLQQRVVTFFDRIRDPDFKPDVFFPRDMGRFEWGVLLHKYFSAGDQIDWQAVIESISR